MGRVIRAHETDPLLREAANNLAKAVKARDAYLEQKTDIKPDTVEAAEATAFLAQLDADIRRYRNAMLALLTD